MPDIDASITANIGKDALGNLGKIAETMNALNQNKLFMGRQAAGAALQQSIDPSTGKIDFARANALIASNPRIAPYAQEAMGEMLTQQGQQIGNTKAGAELAGVYSGLIRQDLSAATTPQQAVAAVARGVAAGRYPRAFAADFLGGSDIGALMKESAVASGSDAAMEAQFGTPTTIQTGATDTATTVNRVTGERNIMGGDAGVVNKTLSPEAAGTTVDYTDTAGVTHTVPRSAVVTTTGQPKPNVPGLTDEHGALTTSLPPGEAKAQEIVATGAADQAQAFAKVAEGTVQRQSMLQELLSTQGEFRSGPGAAKWSGIVTEYNRITGGNLAGDAAAAQQTFGKIAEQVAAAQRDAMGSAATNAQTEAAKLASPNVAYSPEANRRVIAMLRGNEDYIQQKNAAWQAYLKHGGKPSQYNRFVTQFNEIFDPRYYQERYMTPKQKDAMRSAMTPDERKRYDDGKQRALSLDFNQ